MRIHTIDVACPPSPVITAASDYCSLASLGQCDAVLWDPGQLHAGLVSNGMELSVGASMEVFSAIRHWRDEFAQLWSRGGTVVVFLPANTMVRAHHFEDLIDLNLLDALGVDAPRPSGIRHPTGALQPGGQPFHDFFASTRGVLTPVSMLERRFGATVLHSNDGDILASYQTRNAGRLLLLPQLAETIAADDHAVFLRAICLLIARLSDPSLIANAAWLSEISRPNRIDRVTAIENYRREIYALQQKIDALEAASCASAFEAQLVAGTGRGVFRAVFSAIVQMNTAAENDWLNESIVIVPGDEGVLLIKTVLFGEDLDDQTLNGIDKEVARIAHERGPVQGVTVVDCRENIMPLEQRLRKISAEDRNQLDRRGWNYKVGADLFILLSHEDNESKARLSPQKLTAKFNGICRAEDAYIRAAEILR